MVHVLAMQNLIINNVKIKAFYEMAFIAVELFCCILFHFYVKM
jgi:hypothetical protein